MWEICLSTHLSSHLFTATWACGHLFYTLGYNPVLINCLYFVAQIVPVMASESSFSGLLSPFDTFHYCGFYFNTS